MELWSRGSGRSLALALLAASWCTGWLWLLLALMRPLPGVLSFKSDLGALELLELPAGRTYPTVLFAVFLACLLPPLLLSALRNKCDGKGRALQSILWPLRSASFWLSCVAWTTVGIAFAVLLHDRGSIVVIAISSALLLSIAIPFFCLNPCTLDAPSPSHWWKPYWPGWKALLTALALWIVYAATSFALELAIDINPIAWVSVLLSLLDELLSACILVLAVAIWLNRGHWQAVRVDIRRLLGSGFIAEYVWQALAIALLLAVMAFPVLIAAVNVIFVIPQYEYWAEANNLELPLGVRAQSVIARGHELFPYVLIVPFGLYFGLVQGRLIRQHGVGKENQAS